MIELRQFGPIYLLSVDNAPEILGSEDGAEFSGNSAISGHFSNIHGVPHL